MTTNNDIKKSSVSGITTKCIEIAFEHYVQGQNLDGFRKEIEYYKFDYSFEKDEIEIRIMVDQNVIFEKLNIRGLKCGEAIYKINLKTQKITEKIWYK